MTRLFAGHCCPVDKQGWEPSNTTRLSSWLGHCLPSALYAPGGYSKLYMISTCVGLSSEHGWVTPGFLSIFLLPKLWHLVWGDLDSVKWVTMYVCRLSLGEIGLKWWRWWGEQHLKIQHWEFPGDWMVKGLVLLTVEGPGSIPGQGTKISQAVQHS